jgi:hypothetical protein
VDRSTLNQNSTKGSTQFLSLPFLGPRGAEPEDGALARSSGQAAAASAEGDGRAAVGGGPGGQLRYRGGGRQGRGSAAAAAGDPCPDAAAGKGWLCCSAISRSCDACGSRLNAADSISGSTVEVLPNC